MRSSINRVRAGERGQSTAEYVIVLMGAATLALAVLTWAAGSDVVPNLLDQAFSIAGGNGG